MCVDNEESRSRLFRSSCSRRSLEIASGHYGRLLTASPPTVTPFSSSTWPSLLDPPASSRFFLPTPLPILPTFFNPPPFLFLLPPSSFFCSFRPGPPVVCGVHQWRLRPPGRPSPPRVPIHRGGQVTHSFHATQETSNAHRHTERSNGPAECVAAVGIQRRGRQPSSATQAVVSDVPRRLIGDQRSEPCSSLRLIAFRNEFIQFVCPLICQSFDDRTVL